MTHRWWLALLVAAGCGRPAAARPDTTADTVLDATAVPDGVADAVPADDGVTAAMADAATLADAATTQDAVADTVPDPLDADGSGLPEVAIAQSAICFFGAPPGADSFVADVAKPQPCTEVGPPEWFEGKPTPPPTLDVQLGWRDAKKVWHPYKDGDWAGLYVGTQQLFHIDVVPKVLLPGQTAAAVTVQVKTFGLIGCNTVADSQTPKASLVEATDAGPVYTLDPTKAVLTIFGVHSSKIGQYCGLWVEVYWRVRLPNTDQWGEKHLILRTYIVNMIPVNPNGG